MQSPLIDRVRPDSTRYRVSFQMQVIRDGRVIFAIERDSPNERQVREMTQECVKAGARLSQLRLVSKDSDLYDDAFTPRKVC